MDVSSELETQTEVEQSVETPPQTNGLVEEKVRTACEALPGWTRVVVTRKTGNSAGKSDVYYYSPTGKKVRSKPEIEKLLLQTDVKTDLSKFNYRTGMFVERTTTRKRKKPTYYSDEYGTDLADFTMAPFRQTKKLSNGSVTYMSEDLNFKHIPNGCGVGLVSPRQIYWERRLQNMSGQTGLVDFDIFCDKNGEFRSLLHSIVKTLQMERDLTNKKTPESEENHKKPTKKPTKKPIRITKADIRKQEKQVIKARRELAKAIAEYEVLKYS